jgi:hypothetical protein
VRGTGLGQGRCWGIRGDGRDEGMKKYGRGGGVLCVQGFIRVKVVFCLF